MDPRMSWRQSRQSKLMDSEKAATSAAGPAANRPERETGAGVGMEGVRAMISGRYCGLLGAVAEARKEAAGLAWMDAVPGEMTHCLG